MLDIDLPLTSIPIFEKATYDDKIAVILFHCNQGEVDHYKKSGNQENFQDFIHRYQMMSDVNLLFFAENVPQKDQQQHQKDTRTVFDDSCTNKKHAFYQAGDASNVGQFSISPFSNASPIQDSPSTRTKDHDVPFTSWTPPFSTQEINRIENIFHDKLMELYSVAAKAINNSKKTINAVGHDQKKTKIQIFSPISNLETLLLRPTDWKLNRRKSRINLFNRIHTSTVLQAQRSSNKDKDCALQNINVENRIQTTSLLEAYRDCIEQGATHILIHPCKPLLKSAALSNNNAKALSQAQSCVCYDLEDLVEEANSIFPGAQWKITEALDPVEQIEAKWQLTADELVESEFPDIDIIDNFNE